jgi:DNA polymerase-1
MIEGPADSIEEIVARTQEAMAEASAIVLDGFRLRSDASIVCWPDRYMDGRGREFWGRMLALFPTAAELDRRRHPIPATFNEETGEMRGHVDRAGACW